MAASTSWRCERMNAAVGVAERAIDRARAAPGQRSSRRPPSSNATSRASSARSPGLACCFGAVQEAKTVVSPRTLLHALTRVAAVDLGTNSTRLLVADVSDGRVDEVARRLVITRLGEGVDGRRRLLPLPIARVRNCLADFRRELEALGAERTLAIATSAVRDAENGEAFLGEIEWSYGFTTQLLSGHDEALMTFRGVTAGRVDRGGHADRGRRRRLDGARARRPRRRLLPHEPRPRLRAHDRAVRRRRRGLRGPRPLGAARPRAASPRSASPAR